MAASTLTQKNIKTNDSKSLSIKKNYSKNSQVNEIIECRVTQFTKNSRVSIENKQEEKIVQYEI